MSIKLYDKCDECEKKIKNFHIYKNKILCGMCYRKHFIIVPGLPKFFDEPLNCPIAFHITLTKLQKHILDKRMKYLFPDSKNHRGKYLRGLILGDIEYWKNSEERALKEKEV